MVISIIRYCSPILIDSEVKILEKLQTQLMKCTRPILGFSSFKMSTLQIMSELKTLTVHQMVIKESIQYIHKVITNKSPEVIFNLFCQSNCKIENIREVENSWLKFHISRIRLQILYTTEPFIYIIVFHAKFVITK